jgi:hypothetical protein
MPHTVEVYFWDVKLAAEMFASLKKKIKPLSFCSSPSNMDHENTYCTPKLQFIIKHSNYCPRELYFSNIKLIVGRIAGASRMNFKS